MHNTLYIKTCVLNGIIKDNIYREKIIFNFDTKTSDKRPMGHISLTW